METFSTKKSYKSPKKVLEKYVCYVCDYVTCYKKDYEKHLLTVKHRGNTLETVETDFSQEKNWHCLCNKKYKDRSGLWKHRQVCKVLNKQQTVQENSCDEYECKEIDENYNYGLSPEIFMAVIKQNKELQDFLVEQNKSLIELASKNMNGSVNNTFNGNNNNSFGGSQTNNSLNISQTNNNNKFNLQIFLNETCKDAMNIMDFVDTMQIQLSDLEKVGSLGFVDGITSIILKNLKALDVSQRPLHCSDMKRETMYVKDDNKWEKECEDKVRMKKVIKCVANKNMKVIKEWKKQYPECVYSDSKKSDQYNKIVYESIGGISNEETDMFSNKIIKKIAKEVMIHKN
jgi:hypothetical protein